MVVARVVVALGQPLDGLPSRLGAVDQHGSAEACRDRELNVLSAILKFRASSLSGALICRRPVGEIGSTGGGQGHDGFLEDP